VATAEAALVEADAWGPNVVLSDLSLGPGMTGWDLARELRVRGSSARFVLATGWRARIDPATARATGVDEVVAKPYAVDSLLGALSAS
jgi:CheY-like chemotaxis protein